MPPRHTTVLDALAGAKAPLSSRVSETTWTVMAANVHERHLLTPREVADELRYSERSIRRLIDDGHLRALQLGPRRALRIPRSEIERLLEPKGTR
jgi:excisionase family DNA binding protein